MQKFDKVVTKITLHIFLDQVNIILILLGEHQTADCTLDSFSASSSISSSLKKISQDGAQEYLTLAVYYGENDSIMIITNINISLNGTYVMYCTTYSNLDKYTKQYNDNLKSKKSI